MIFLRRTLFWGACYLMSSRVGLGDWHGPLWGFHLRDRRLTVVLSTLTPWVEGLVGEGRPYWPELSPGDSWERDGVEG
jgi:hypothetical protein